VEKEIALDDGVVVLAAVDGAQQSAVGEEQALPLVAVGGRAGNEVGLVAPRKFVDCLFGDFPGFFGEAGVGGSGNELVPRLE
jgi:hypothetical protein